MNRINIQYNRVLYYLWLIFLLFVTVIPKKAVRGLRPWVDDHQLKKQSERETGAYGFWKMYPIFTSDFLGDSLLIMKNTFTTPLFSSYTDLLILILSYLIPLCILIFFFFSFFFISRDYSIAVGRPLQHFSIYFYPERDRSIYCLLSSLCFRSFFSWVFQHCVYSPMVSI